MLWGWCAERYQQPVVSVYPDLAYDSWVTIGLEGAPNALAGEANVSCGDLTPTLG